jgi:sulfatase maturation enzyme AslB (radical SAM superfamily)
MCDYSIYEKPSTRQFSMNNPKPNLKKNSENKIRFRVGLLKRRVSIVLCKDDSLEDLYIKIYNAVYPEFSTEKYDAIPEANSVTSFKNFPYLYHVSIINEKQEIVSIPLHKFITISSFMKTKPDFFKNIAVFGMPTFKIYALDEDSLKELNKGENEQRVNYFQKLTSCITRKN